MKALLALAATLALAASALSQSLDVLQQSFMAKYDALNRDRDQKLEKLTSGYSAALTRLLDELKASGNLDAVLPVRDELTAVERNTWPLPDLPNTANPRLRDLRTKYADAHDKATKSHAADLVALVDKMQALLKDKEAELTKKGDLDGALAARKMGQTLDDDPALMEAREQVLLRRASGGSKPAMQIRRFGDNLEVVVHYDRHGKVSMDSPVTNVRERTAPGRELGDTKATTLGEFVGAKGYNTEPYVTFNQSFDQRDIGSLIPWQMAVKPGYAVAGRKGLRVSYSPNAKTPYLHFRNTVPPASAPGTFRVSISYFLPKTNRLVSHFILMQGESGGSPLGGVLFNANDDWVDGVAESHSVTDSTNIVLCFQPFTAVGRPDAAADYVVLEKVRIEQFRFSAYLQKRLSPDSQIVHEQSDPSKQSLAVSNGVVLSP